MTWIRLEDEFPQDGQEVLVTGDGWIGIDLVRYDDKQMKFIPVRDNIFGEHWDIEPYSIGGGRHSVTFWMPTPELPDKVDE